MTWKPTPKGLLYKIRRYDRATGSWSECAFTDLQPGDIYASFAQDGAQVEPIDGEPAEVYLRVLGEPFRNEVTGYGYTVEAEYGTLEDLIAAGVS